MAKQEYGMTASDGNKYLVDVVPACRKYCSKKKTRNSVRQPRFVVCQIELIHNKYI